MLAKMLLTLIFLFCGLVCADNEELVDGSLPTPEMQPPTPPAATTGLAGMATLPPSRCEPLAPGSSIILDESPLVSPTGVQRRYKLTRSVTDPNRYIAEFNLRFSPTEDAVGERYQGQAASPNDLFKDSPQATRQDEMRAALIARTRECFQQNQGQLRAGDGTVLELRLSPANDPSPPPQVTVEINTATARSNAGSWARQIQCPTIIHEVFHLMGLCDGYRESQTRVPEEQSLFRVTTGGPDQQSLQDPKSRIEPTFMYNCRSVEPADSIMRNQFTSLQRMYEVKICVREDLSLPLSQQVSQLPERCPDGHTGTSQLLSHEEYVRRVSTPPNLTYQLMYYYRPLPPRTQTVYPAQMRLIIQPHCHSANQRYIDCAQNAYRTLQVDGCVNVPSFCTSGDFMN